MTELFHGHFDPRPRPEPLPCRLPPGRLRRGPCRSRDRYQRSDRRVRRSPLGSPPRSLPPLDNLPVFYDLALDVDAAYAAIPHRRTVFDFDHTSLPAADAAYLQRAFHLIDQGVRARVVGYRDLYSQGVSDSEPVERMEELIDALESIDPPTDLAAYHSALIEAIIAQRTVFQDWTDRGQDVPNHQQIARNANVRKASRHLRHAYDLLMQAYGRNESDHNKAAFFDYHCALDFI